MDKVGKDGVVTVEEGQGLRLESDVVEGFTFDRGFISPYMVTDTARMEAVYDKPSILVIKHHISLWGYYHSKTLADQSKASSFNKNTCFLIRGFA